MKNFFENFDVKIKVDFELKSTLFVSSLKYQKYHRTLTFWYFWQLRTLTHRFDCPQERYSDELHPKETTSSEEDHASDSTPIMSTSSLDDEEEETFGDVMIHQVNS